MLFALPPAKISLKLKGGDNRRKIIEKVFKNIYLLAFARMSQ